MSTNPIDDNIDIIAQKITQLAQSNEFDDLPQPVNIEYGFGWSPTISIWYKERRCHLYWSLYMEPDDGITIELADPNSNPPVLSSMIYTYEELWNVIKLFLKDRVNVVLIPNHDWQPPRLNHDKFIPHPPSKAGWQFGNIAAFVDQAELVNNLPPSNPNNSKSGFAQKLRHICSKITEILTTR